jgi:L-histidine Nalpha-methyltransferase
MNEAIDPTPKEPTSSAVSPMTMERRLSAAKRIRQFRRDTLLGLSSEPPFLYPKWCYDETGGRIFEAITGLPEYYLTRREFSIITKYSTHLAAVTQAELVMELGSGSSKKTRTILTALNDGGFLSEFVPLDVDEAMLNQAGREILRNYPGVNVHAIVGDYEYNISPIPQSSGRRLILFLGSTIGNLRPTDRRHFLETLRQAMSEQDMLLLGIDLVKSAERLVAAYNDSIGLNTAFARNALSVINHSLGGDFSLDVFRHYAEWNALREQMEMYLEVTADQRIHIRDIDLTLDMSRGDRIQTEISAKFRMQTIESELIQSGFRISESWTDNQEDFALVLAQRE